MKFLLDVNASGPMYSWLVELGHDVVQVGTKDPRMSDSDILSWAVREKRIIVTTDNDFEEMIWREGMKHCGVLRLENVPRSERKALLCDALEHYGQVLESGSIVIALSKKFRVRRPIH
jgi:predicted nuclease of predicted toxin-antitoxin system